MYSNNWQTLARDLSIIHYQTILLSPLLTLNILISGVFKALTRIYWKAFF